MAQKLFTERMKPQPDTLSYAIPTNVRIRVAHVFHNLPYLSVALPTLWLEVGIRCIGQYGELAGDALFKFPSKPGEQQVFAHAAKCSDAQFIDFVEMCFQADAMRARQPVVDQVNEVFRSEGIGYEFSPYVIKHVPLPPIMGTPSTPSRTGVRYVPQAPLGSGKAKAKPPTSAQPQPKPHVPTKEVVVSYPQATMKSSELLHSTTVMPALHLLTDSRFKTADEEMLKAHKHFRDGDYPAALNECGKAFESVFKTILTLKGWPYDPNKDTISKLIDIARDNGLFPAYYVEELKFVGTIRNKLGSHGGGPNLPHGKPDERHAEHHLHITASHILFLARMANL